MTTARMRVPGSNPGTARQCNKMDIVFVVDDSGSMAEEQTNLATNFPMFAQLLSHYQTSTASNSTSASA